MSFCRTQPWSACAGMHGSASPPHPPPSPALLGHHHLPHPHQACGEERRRDSLVAAKEGEKREAGMGGGRGRARLAVSPLPQPQCLWGRGCGGRRRGDGAPPSDLPTQAPAPLLPGLGQHTARSMPQLVHSQLHAHWVGFSEALPSGAPSPRACKLMRLTPAREGGAREDGVTLLSLSM